MKTVKEMRKIVLKRFKELDTYPGMTEFTKTRIEAKREILAWILNEVMT